MPDWVPKQPMTLGLDLQGGSHILLAVDRQDLIDERLQATRDDIRTLLRDAKIGYTGLSGTRPHRAGAHPRGQRGREGQDGAGVADCSRSRPACSAPARSTNWRWTSPSRACCATR